MTFYRLLFSRYNHLSDQLFSRHNYSRHSYSRCGYQTWRFYSLDVTVLQTQLFSKHSYWLFSSGYSPEVAALYIAVLQTWLPSRRGYSLDMAALQTQLFSRRSYPLDVAILQTQLFSRYGCQLFSSSCSPEVVTLHVAILQTQLFSRHSSPIQRCQEDQSFQANQASNNSPDVAVLQI